MLICRKMDLVPEETWNFIRGGGFLSRGIVSVQKTKGQFRFSF